MTGHCVAGGRDVDGAAACGPLFHRWVRADVLVAPRTDVLPPLLDAIGSRHGYPPAVASALFWKQYAWYVVDAALRGWTTGPVPDLTLERTAIWIGCEGRTVQVSPGEHDQAPSPRATGSEVGVSGGAAAADASGGSGIARGSRVANGAPGPADGEFAGWFRTEVVKAHLEPVLEHLHERSRAGRRLLWGSVAHAVALPLSRQLNDPGRAVPDVLDRIGAPVAGLVGVGPDGEVSRRTCCLAFRMPTPAICDYCPIRTADCSPLDRHPPPQV